MPDAGSRARRSSGAPGPWAAPILAIASDAEQDMVSSFDPVWDGHAHRDALGWTVEMRIPFNQLRRREVSRRHPDLPREEA